MWSFGSFKRVKPGGDLLEVASGVSYSTLCQLEKLKPSLSHDGSMIFWSYRVLEEFLFTAICRYGVSLRCSATVRYFRSLDSYI